MKRRKNSCRLICFVLCCFCLSAWNTNSRCLWAEDFFKIKESIIKNAWKRIAFLYIRPQLTLENTGYTSNIYYYENMEEPDWTADLGINLQVSSILGERFIISINENPYYSFYAQNAEQRAWSNRFKGTVYTYLGSLNLQYEYGNDSIKGRPNPEFGSYVKYHKESHYLSMDIGKQKNFFLRLFATMDTNRFEDEAYLGQYNLIEGLNQTRQGAGALLSKIIFTRTELFLKYEYFQYTFEFTPSKDGIGNKASIGIEFPEISKIQGDLEFGIQAFQPGNPLYRSYTKPFASANVNARLLTRIKLHLRCQFNNYFSFWQQDQDFDEQSLGGGLEFYFTQNIKIGCDTQTSKIVYENLSDGSITRHDTIRTAAFYLGVRVFKNMGIGLEYRKYRTSSDLLDLGRNSDFIGGYFIHEF